jgi:hypothetical protein
MKSFKIPFSKGAKGLLWLPSEGVQFMSQELRARVYRGRSGEVEDLGIISRKMVTTEGVNYIKAAMQGGYSLNEPVFCLGGGSGAEAITDTFVSKFTGGSPITGLDSSANDLAFPDNEQDQAFVTPVLTVGTKTLILESNFDFVNHADASITELFFCFNRAYNNVQYLFDRSLFTAISVTATDKIKFTFTLMFSDGG